MGNDTPLSVVRENIVGYCDEITVITAWRQSGKPNYPALERLEAALNKAVARFKEETK